MTEPLTSDTLGEILSLYLKSRKCFGKRNGCTEPLCGHLLSEKALSKVEQMLKNRITYLPGDKAKIDEEIMEIARLLIQSNMHGKWGPQLVLDFAKDLGFLMNQHYESREHQSSGLTVAGPEPTSVPGNLSVTQLDPTEITDATKASEISEIAESVEKSDFTEVTYPALRTAHAIVTEDKVELDIDSSYEPHALLPLKNTQTRSVTKSPTPLFNEVPIPSDPVTNVLPWRSNPLLSLVLNIISQMLVGFFSSVQARRGVVPVENTSGQTKNKSVLDLKIMLGLRLPTGMIPILLFVIGVCLYCHAWSVIGSLIPYVLIAVASASCSRWISSGSEVIA